LAAALVTSALPAYAQKVFIDYDKNYDRSTIKTFAWVDNEEHSLKNVDPLMHTRIVDAIKRHLAEAGWTEAAPDQADVHVTYHGSSKEEMSINTTSMGYGYPSGWAYGGYYGYYGYPAVGISGSTSTVSTYKVGTLVVDVWDLKTQKLIWRGQATDIVISANPAKMEKKVDTALEKLVHAWEKTKAKEQKTRRTD
jgi:hypothetical protein